jgi:hypothetical protein
MTTLTAIIALAWLTEALTEYIGTNWLSSQYKPFLAMLVGVGLALAYNADLMALLGFQSDLPYVGEVLTGLLASRGANYLNDVLSHLGGRPVFSPPPAGETGDAYFEE